MTPEQIATLPDDLLSARHAIDIGAYWNTGLIDLAAERICDLEEEVLKLRRAIVGHRGSRDFVGGHISADVDLWGHVADMPWGVIKGDG